MNPLYGSANPPVTGHLLVWSFQSAQEEAHAIAQSCQELINAGMAGQEDEILILITNRKVQLNPIAQELGNLGLLYAIIGVKATLYTLLLDTGKIN
jgi:superfamily I DNA/RNA helicase